MKIVVDGGCFGVEERYRFGVHRFSKNFLTKLSEVDKENEYFIYSLFPIERKLRNVLGENFKNIVFKPRRGFLKAFLPFLFLKNRYSCYVGLSQAIPWFHPFKTIAFVHDLAFEKYPEYFPDTYDKLSALTKKTVLESDRIIVFSENTKGDVMSFYRIDDRKLTVLPQGVDSIFKPVSNDDVSEKFGIKKYFLYVGDFKRVKNTPFLIRAFARYIRKNKKKVKLVLIGGRLGVDNEIQEVISAEKIGGYVKSLGRVSDEDLVKLYSKAEAFISPSLYEGFGHPVLEAAACGCLVVCSDIKVHRETIGREGIFFNLNDLEDLVNSLEKVNTMTEREKKAKKKRLKLRSKKFSWDILVKGFLKLIYENRTY